MCPIRGKQHQINVAHGVKVIYGTYYETFVEFKNAALDFFRDIGEYHQELSTLMADNFRVVKI
jgi:hypothetical protein